MKPLKTALVIGATGATGKPLVEQLLNNQDFGSVIAFVRKPLAVASRKLVQHRIDFDDAASWRELVRGDVLFSCLGTTLKDAGSQAAQWKIDYDYQYAFAEAAKQNNVPGYILVSAEQADPAARLFYSRMKGELEQAVTALGFERCIIARPPLLHRPNSRRKLENLAVCVLEKANRLGLFTRHRPLPTNQLAQALIIAERDYPPGTHILDSRAIRQLLAHSPAA